MRVAPADLGHTSDLAASGMMPDRVAWLIHEAVLARMSIVIAGDQTAKMEQLPLEANPAVPIQYKPQAQLSGAGLTPEVYRSR